MARTKTGKLWLRDRVLFFLTLAASVLGLFFVFDSGYARSEGLVPPEFWRQLVFLPVAILVSALVSSIRPDFWQRGAKLIWMLSLGSLLLVYVPGLGLEINGSHRWIRLGPVLIQPAEFAKFAAVIYLAGALADRKLWPARLPACKSWASWMDTVAVPKLARLFPGIWVMLAAFLIEQEPDLGTASIVIATTFALCWAGGVSGKSLAAGMLVIGLGVVVLVMDQPYRLARISNHAHRWSAENIDDIGYQTVQSEIAMASGGVLGVGIGAGRAKYILPATTTDFVMATVGEEFGLLGSLGVLALLGAIVLRLLWLSARAPNSFSSLVLIGVASWIGVQTCVNMMMANGFCPPIGIPLPFISYGGSSLLSLWLAMGVCQAVMSPQLARERPVEGRDHGWRDRRTRLSRA